MERGECKVEPVVTAASRYDWAEVRRLVESGANVNARDEHDFDSLYYAIQRERYDEMEFLLQHGADRSAEYVGNPFYFFGRNSFSLTAAEFAASTFDSDQVRTLFLGGQPLPLEMLEMRAVRKLLGGDRQSASECFFGPNSGNRNFDELFERSIQFVEKKWPGDIFHEKLCYIVVIMLENNQEVLDTNTAASIVTNLISQQKLSVLLVAIYRIDELQTYEVLDLLMSKYNEIVDEESPMFIYVMENIVSRIIRLFKRGEVSKETVSKLAAQLLKFPAKLEVLFSAVEACFPDTIKFLVEECCCNPHALNLETSESTLDLLFSSYLFHTEIEKEQLKDSAKFLLDLGVHSCPRLTSPEGRKVLRDFPEFFHTVRRLECLAASKIAEEGIDTDGLPTLLKKFIKQH